MALFAKRRIVFIAVDDRISPHQIADRCARLFIKKSIYVLILIFSYATIYVYAANL